ncbi:MAG TPA: aminotransferase class V-fold PLP-dependent enzyme [Methylomirabilota bacterium]
MSSRILQELGLRRVVNARGPMTISGAAAMPREVIEAMADVAGSFVFVDELRERVNAAVTSATGAESALVTSGAAAGIVAAIAASMTGLNRARVSRLPDTTGMPNEVVVQTGHLVTYVHQVRMTGARVVPVGAVYPVLAADLEAAIGPQTAAIFHVISQHCPQKGTVPLDEVIQIGKARGIPVIVDAAAEIDLRRHVAAGADVVIYSGGKAIPGPSATGFICGRRGLIQAAALHFEGICRPMKVGKEGMVALLAALRLYERRDHQHVAKTWMRKCERILGLLADVRSIDVRIRRDWTYQLDPDDRALPRVEVRFDERDGARRAKEVSRVLRAGDPAILLRDYWTDSGVFHIDVTCLDDEEVALVADRVREAISGSQKGARP